jgi:hypothetical protein
MDYHSRVRRVAELLSGPLLVAGAALAVAGMIVYITGWVAEPSQGLLGFVLVLGVVVALLGFPSGWVLQGGWTAYTRPEGWGAYRGWSRRAGLLGGLSFSFVLLNFLAMMVLQTPEAFTRGYGSLFGVMGILAAASARFQRTTPVERWMRRCERGHPAPAFRTRCGRCGASLSD